MAGEGKPLQEEVEDLSWAEVAKLGQGYLRIPFALLLVEIFYWFITQPTNTLGLIQESEIRNTALLRHAVFRDEYSNITVMVGHLEQLCQIKMGVGVLGIDAERGTIVSLCLFMPS